MARRPSASTPRPQRTTSRHVTVPSPYKGLNTVDSLAAMDPAYAISCQNWIATPQGLSLRQGYRTWAAGLPGDVTSLMPYHAQNAATSKLFAVSVSGFYDVTFSGAVAAPVVSGLNASNPYWQFANQTAISKNFLMCVNGADSPRMYDGTSWTTCSQVASPSTLGQFTNVDNNGATVNIQNFVDVTLHQKRLWFVANNSTKAYYTDVNTPTGTLYSFDFGNNFPRGGKLQKLTAWSANMGSVQGVQSNLVAISDKGDVVIYVGNDPNNPDKWALSAVYQLGAPTGRRCTSDFESDMLYLSRDGLYPLSQYIQSDTVSNTDAITTKISPTVGDLIQSYGAMPGFEMVLYPGNNVVLLNIPGNTTASNFQFCFNTVTSGWTQFTGWNAACWGLFNNTLFFGGTGSVNLAFIGYKDGADINGNGGNAIIATTLTAFDYFNEVGGLGRGVLKQVKEMKPIFITGNASPTISIGINTDFNLVPISGSATVNPAIGGVWDSAIWDNPNAIWQGSLATYNQWATPLCWDGDAIAIAVSISTTTQTVWTATTLLISPGGSFG